MPRAPHILVVDDDALIRELLSEYFGQCGWTSVEVATGEEALKVMERDRRLDLVLLDVHLPAMSGFDVLDVSQALGLLAPVVMISTDGESDKQLDALGLGAKDYFSKPLQLDALRERIEAILRFGSPAPSRLPAAVELGPTRIDLEQGLVVRGGEERPLPEVHRRLLALLLAHPGQPVSRKRLLVEGLGVDQQTIRLTLTLRALYEMLDRHVELLQELVEPDPDEPRHLLRVYGQGYQLMVSGG